VTASYRFDHLLCPDGWLSPGFVDVDDAGTIASVTDKPSPETKCEPVSGFAIAGMPNLHSHAFQRAMAGLAERAGPGDDSFWTWRETMYRFVDRLSPDDLEAIAGQLYVEMLKAGYTSVGEFHYLHHAPDGRPYDDSGEMSRRIFAAAAEAGIGLTLLPVLYASGGFGGEPTGPGQRRFVCDADAFLDLVASLARDSADDPQCAVGIAPHSLRAVPPELLEAALEGFDTRAPVHIHIAEQTKEVDDCIAWCGARPVEWLLSNADVNERWCLVHATHMTPAEADGLATSGAVAGLCPTTEANLGDGFFALSDFRSAGGRWGIGSDSNVSISPVEELRWLEYGQRLLTRKRGISESGEALYLAALDGGARALGRPIGAIETGRRADIVVLDDGHPNFAGLGREGILDACVFSGNVSPVRDVMVGGVWTVREGTHRDETAIARRYSRTMNRLLTG
jgi:formimidoylglutamate deiminase